MEEKRTVVLPVLLRDCSVPLFFREKLYADFRTDFDDGLSTILESIAGVTNQWRNRIERPTWHTDWSMDWMRDERDGTHLLRLTLIELAEERPYSILSVVTLLPEPEANAWYANMLRNEHQDEAHRHIIESLSKKLANLDYRLLLKDHIEKKSQILFDTEYGRFYADIRTRWLGMDPGRNVLFDMAQQFEGITTQMNQTVAKPMKRNMSN